MAATARELESRCQELEASAQEATGLSSRNEERRKEAALQSEEMSRLQSALEDAMQQSRQAEEASAPPRENEASRPDPALSARLQEAEEAVAALEAQLKASQGDLSTSRSDLEDARKKLEVPLLPLSPTIHRFRPK